MISQITNTFIQYLQNIIPWLLLGTAFAYVIDRFLPRRDIGNYLNKLGSKNIFLIHLLGMVSPLSIMSFLPIAEEFVLLGASPAVILTFLMAERAYDAQSIFIISGLFGLKTAILNFLAIFISLSVASYFLKNEKIELKGAENNNHHFWKNQARIFIFVLLGVAAASVFRHVIPQGLFFHYASGESNSTLAALIFGFLFYFGTILGNYPIAKTFADLGMAPLGVFIFLTVAPLLNLVIILLFSGIAKIRPTLKYIFIYSLVGLLISFSLKLFGLI